MWQHRMIRGLYTALCFVFLTACGNATSCGDSVSRPYPNPAPPGGQIQTSAVRARIMQRALDTLAAQLRPLLTNTLAGIDHFSVRNGMAIYTLDETLLPSDSPLLIRDGCLGPTAPGPACATPTATSQVSMDLNALSRNLKITLLPDDAQGHPGVRFSVGDIDIFLDAALGLKASAVLPDAICRIHDAGSRAAIRVERVAFDIRVEAQQSATGMHLLPRLEQPIVTLGHQPDNPFLQMSITACDGRNGCTDPICAGSHASDCQQVCGVFDVLAQLSGFFAQFIEPMLNQIIPTFAQALGGGLMGGLSALPLENNAEIALSGLLGPMFTGFTPVRLHTGMSAGPHSTGAGPAYGLDFGLDLGVTAQPNVCTADAAPPELPPVGTPPDYSEFVEIRDADNTTHFERYHIAVSMAEASLVQALWAAYSGGLMCFNLDAYEISQAVGSRFAFTAGLLLSFDARLAGLTNPQAPMLAAVHANNPPRIHLGADAPIDEHTNEPLLEISLDDLSIGLHMLIDESQLEVTELLADVVVRLGIERTPHSGLNLVLRSLTVNHVRQVYNEIAPNSDLSGLIEVIVDLAMSTVLGTHTAFPIDLSRVLSNALQVPIELHMNTIRRDFGPAGDAYVSMYATLCGPDDVRDQDNPVCYRPSTRRPLTRGNAPSIRGVDAASLSVQQDNQTRPSGQARLWVDAGSNNEREIEYQWRVDDGLWSHFVRSEHGALLIHSARLKVAADHNVQMRWRYFGEYASLSEAMEIPVTVEAARFVQAPDAPSEQPSHGCAQTQGGWLMGLLVLGMFLRRRLNPNPRAPPL